jgi:O-Antigen ligase
MPTPSRYQPAHIAVFTIVTFAEVVYRYAKKVAEFLTRPIFWPTILLFIPKINLISFREETAGIRLDDVVLLTVICLLLCSWIVELEFHVDTVPAMGLAVVAVFCTSNLLNAGHSNVLYSLRLVEYLVFYWSGKYLARRGHDFALLVKLLIGVNCGFILLQYVGIVGGFTADGYETAVERPFGLSANHPAEMGAFLNLLFAALVFGSKPASRFWYSCVFIGLCIFITGSRSALFAHCLLTLVYVYKHSRNKTVFALRTAFVSGLLVAVFAVIPNAISSRSTDLFSAQNLETFGKVYDDIPVDRQFTGFVDGGDPDEAPEGVDPSWYMRGYKWAQVVKTMFASPWTVWIFGLGPGALTPALDGGWLRLISESGVVGTIAFLSLMRKISLLNTACLMAVVALALNMLMVDSHNAYKVMAFLFFLAGTGSFASSKLQQV